MILIIPIKTRLIKPEDDLFELFKNSLKKQKIKVQEKDIIVIASKIVSLTEKNFVKYTKKNKKELHKTLIIKESDHIFGKEYPYLTLKNGIICPNAGIDESNTIPKSFILWPKNPQNSAQNFWNKLKKEYKLKQCGVILTDSTCYPLKEGTIQMAIGFAGVKPITDYRNKVDVYGRKFKISQRSDIDTLACAGGLAMGEGDEKTPFAIIRNTKIQFSDKRCDMNKIDKKKCIFKTFLGCQVLE